jgi:hypothetical protein
MSGYHFCKGRHARFSFLLNIFFKLICEETETGKRGNGAKAVFSPGRKNGLKEGWEDHVAWSPA